jgi:hypothetical protein
MKLLIFRLLLFEEFPEKLRILDIGMLAMTIYSKKARFSSSTRKMTTLTLFVVSIANFLIPAAFADVVSDAKISESVSIGVEGHSILLVTGTPVQVITIDGNNAAISLQLQNGGSVLTQIPTKYLEMLPPKQDSLTGGGISGPNPVAAPPVAAPPPDTDINPQQVYPDFSTTLTPQDVELPLERFTALNGYFYVLINGIAVPVVYSLPMEGHHLAESASNLVFYGPYPGEQTKLTGNIVPDIVTKLGCSVFSFSFKNNDLSSPKTAYWSKESGWFNAALAARNEIIKGFGLERKKLILMGYSGGGGMVLNFAGAFPDEVDAVAAHGANLAPAITQKTSVKWFIVNNRGEKNSAVTQPFSEKLRTLGCDVLYCETTPERGRGNYHAPSGQAFDLIYTYIASILEQRKRIEAGIDDVNRIWPYASPVDPLKQYAIVKTSVLNEEEINGGAYNLLPSAAFALNWSKVCPPIQTITPWGETSRLHVSFPSLQKPNGVIMYFDRPDYQSISREVEDVSSLAEHGCVVISPTYNMQPDRFVQAASAWILSQNRLHAVPIHLAGYGAPGADFISLMNNQIELSCKSLTLIGLAGFPLKTETRDNIEALAKECGLYSFAACGDSTSITDLRKLANDLITRGSQVRGCQGLFLSDQVDKEKIEEQAIETIKQTVDDYNGSILSTLPDIMVDQLVVPKDTTVNQKVDVTVHVHDCGIYGKKGTIQLMNNRTVLAEQSIEFNFDGDQVITLSYVPTKSGEFNLEVAVPPLPEESSKDNNSASVTLVVQ